MNSTLPPRPPAGMPACFNHGLLTGLVLLWGVVAVTTQSFWMDEASAAMSATQPTLAGWWQYLSSHHGSDHQMPFYMLYLWGWVKVFGCTEWILRAANLPWLLAGWLALPRRLSTGVFLALASSSFLWFYLNEARPYVMQISSSLILAGALIRLLDPPAGLAAKDEKKHECFWGGIFCLGLVLLSGSSMLGMIWATAAAGGLIAGLGARRAWRLVCAGWTFFLTAALILAGLSWYYFWTLQQGSRATPGTMGIKNILFIFYELAGFAGLGPGRGDIHGNGHEAFRSVFIVPLMLYALALGTVIVAGVWPAWRTLPRRAGGWLTAAIGGAALILLLVGATQHFSVLGRHFAPLGTAGLLLLGLGLQRLLAAGGWRRWAALAWLLLSVVSALSLRFCERHEKDDYRTAAQFALAAQAKNQRVWWCADGTTGWYYGVPLSPTGLPAATVDQIWNISNLPGPWLAGQPVPDVLILSKPEHYDGWNSVRDYLKQYRFQCVRSFSVFTVWTPAPRPE